MLRFQHFIFQLPAMCATCVPNYVNILEYHLYFYVFSTRRFLLQVQISSYSYEVVWSEYLFHRTVICRVVVRKVIKRWGCSSASNLFSVKIFFMFKIRIKILFQENNLYTLPPHKKWIRNRAETWTGNNKPRLCCKVTKLWAEEELLQ